ncbi:MAG: MlaD family protein [Deltaproteobacteria bacterium]|nr:MlaD family protein [Deltaproteobacteria bacterium]
MKFKAAFSVGLLVILMGGAGFALLQYVKEGVSEDAGYKVHARFSDAQGLFGKSRVQTAGIEIGKIFTKELSPRRDGDGVPMAKVVVIIDKTIVLYESATIAKRAASLLGEYYLEIDPGMPIGPNGKVYRQLKDGDEILHVVEGLKTSDIVDEVGQTIPILREILSDVRTLTSGPITEIAHGVNASIAKNSEVLERLLQRADNIAADIEGITRSESDDIKIALTNVREITESIKKLVGASESQVTGTGQKLQSTIEQLQSTVTKLEKTMGNVEKVTDHIADGQGTIGMLAMDDDIANNVQDVTEDVGTFVKGVTQLQTIVGLRTEFNYLASTFKNYLSIQLAPRPDKYYLIELVDDPRGFRNETLETELRSDTGFVSTKRVTISEQLRFTFMFAKRIGSVTGRFGILESTGGGSLDVHLVNDRLTLTVDVFDTRSNIYPRVRTRAAFSVYKKIFWLVAGADDVLNTERARAGGGAFLDAFFGAQLVFNDEDLRTLLLFGGSSVGSAAGSR